MALVMGVVTTAAMGATLYRSLHERELALAFAAAFGLVLIAATLGRALRRDMVERGHAEKVAAEFAAIVTSSMDAIVSKSLDGTVRSWNPSAEHLFGYTASEMIGRSIRCLIPPERQDEEDDILARIAVGERIAQFDTIRLHKDGRPIDVSVTISPILDASGNVTGASKIARDITEQKKVETILRESETQFRALADGMPTLCWIANADGWIFWYNRGWYDYTGTTPERMEGWGWQSVHDPAMLPRVMARWQDSIATGKPFEMTFPLRGADGTFRPFLTRIIPLHAADGTVFRWFGTNTDVAEARRNAEMLERMVEERTAALLREVEERRVAEETLRQSEKLQLIGQLTGGIAHDFNNVLQVVSAGVRLLKSPRLTDERKATLLDEMERSGENAAAMVTRLLAFARRQSLNPRAFDANECLRGMIGLLRRTLGSQIEVKTDLAPGLWPVLADPNQFEVALLNLVVNARDAMSLGGTLTLRTCNDATDGTMGRVWITVEDTGTGMLPAVRERIFEPFFTTKEVGKGTGLGLPQVHGFARQSDGDVRVESEPGIGTKVTLCLPRASDDAISPDDAARGVEALHNAEFGAALARATGKVILVVDDNREVAALAAAMLEGLGYTVRQAGNAPEALALLDAGERVDAVFSDVVMPGHINGAELASILSMRYPRVAVLMATGYSDQRDRLSGLPVEVLAKPYTLDELAAALERALRIADAPHRATLAS